MMSFQEFAKFLEKQASRTNTVLKETMAEIGMRQVTIAKEYIGQELPEWPELSETTLHGWAGFPGKIELGYTGRISATDPLYREGDMRESIMFRMESDFSGVTLDVGSDSKVALWQEMGTEKIPPRPFISLSAIEVQLPAQLALGKAAASLLTPKE